MILMNIKQRLKSSKLLFSLRILHEMFLNYRRYVNHLSNYARKDNKEKMSTDLIIRTHALEKGMSIGSVRTGFGKSKAISLIRDLDKYLSIDGNISIVNDACSVINKYIAYNKSIGAGMDDVESLLNLFMKKYPVKISEGYGIYNLTHQTLKESEKAPFDVFSQARFSIRDFGTSPIIIENIKKALTLCEKTPSACNRQGWKVHVYTDKFLKNEILNLQLGNKGFTDDIQAAILICGNLNSYGFPEFFLPYVDAGLYAMNLMYALSFYDIASIPLTMAHKHSWGNKQRKALNFPENEVPVILIGIGSYKEEFKVAVSHRYPFETYTTFNG